MIPLITDLHAHSLHSVDSSESLANMCRAAIDKGIKIIAFTEHVDMNPNDEGYLFFDYDKFSRSIDEVRDTFDHEITILKGIEFGEPHLYPKVFETLLQKDFDIVIGAVHWIDEVFVGDESMLKKYSLSELFNRYYNDVLEMVRFGGFDVLAHFDFPKRYFKIAKNNCHQVDEILQLIKEADIALEINSSPIRRGFEESAPDREILERYLNTGGTRITIGSDAHRAEDIGADFGYVENLLREVGVNRIGIFNDRSYEEIKI